MVAAEKLDDLRDEQRTYGNRRPALGLSMPSIDPPQRPEPNPPANIAPPAPLQPPTSAPLSASAMSHQAWEVSAVSPVLANGGGAKPAEDNAAESSPDKLRRRQLENE